MSTAFQARYVFPVAGKPIEGGVVTIDGGRIVEFGREIASGADVVDLNAENEATSGGAALLPGLVNAHTHLEFSDLESPLGQPGMRFPDWIRAVIAHRQGREATDADNPQEDRTRAVSSGLLECIHAGTTAVGEIATADWPWLLLLPQALGGRAECPSVAAFYEILGLADDRAETAAVELNAARRRFANVSERWQFAVSPHAPYSTHWQVVENLCDYSRDHVLPLAMHLAESPEELELLATHGGPFRQLLDELDVWNAGGVPRGGRPMDYLKLLSSAHRSLVIHGNYLSDEEIQFLAAHPERMSAVFCPRTHGYFEHDPYPLAKMLAAGANVALGTDSRASTPDLNLLAEMRHVAKHFGDVSGETVLECGTLGGARALGLDQQTGSLEPGKRADFAVVALPDRGADPYELLFDSDLPTVATFLAGRQQ